MFFLLYVDDIILTGNQLSLFSSFINTLGKEFEPGDLGLLSYFWDLKQFSSLLSCVSLSSNILLIFLNDFVWPTISFMLLWYVLNLNYWSLIGISYKILHNTVNLLVHCNASPSPNHTWNMLYMLCSIHYSTQFSTSSYCKKECTLLS